METPYTQLKPVTGYKPVREFYKALSTLIEEHWSEIRCTQKDLERAIRERKRWDHWEYEGKDKDD